MHPKIKPKHLEKIAYLYLRQSSPKQLIDHKESPRVQLGLRDTLSELGFTRICVIDTDLGKSAAGYTHREGFTTILNGVCNEHAGAVASWEASRLARNDLDWHNLTLFCQITDTLIIDESGVYDPASADDAMMLGIKAAMCKYELNLLSRRARAGLLEKAKRGELYTLISSGFYLTDDGRCEMEMDERVRETIKLVFDKFDQLGSARQVLLWFRQEKVEFPKARYYHGRRTIEWELPIYSTILEVLKNPIYAGAYTWGRRETRTFIREQKPVKTGSHPLPMQEWQVLIVDHHPGYISWEKFLKNQNQLRENSNKFSPVSKGAAKKGNSLLAGLITCGHCGRSLKVKYSGQYGNCLRYICRGAFTTTGDTRKCLSISARKLEPAIVQEVLKTVEPAAITAAIEAEKRMASEGSERQKRLELALEQAGYEADRRERQFNAVEPENRLVVREVQALWNQALEKAESLTKELEWEKQTHRPLTEIQRQQLYTLAQDLPRLWNLPSTDERTKTRIIRTLIESIIAQKETDSDWYRITIRWAGSLHSEIRLKQTPRGENGFKTDKSVIELIKELAMISEDKDIARVLNRCGLKTGTGQHWTQIRVRGLRYANQIPAFSKKQDEKADILTLGQAAEQLQISPDSVTRLIKSGLIEARQIAPYTPWIVRCSELEKKAVIAAVKSIQKNGKAKIQINQTELSY